LPLNMAYNKMDLVDLIAEKRFLGQEFLTWLWWKSEERGGSIELAGDGDITVVFEKKMVHESGAGVSSEKIVCTGLQAELQEARTGLKMGKKLEQARILIGHGNYEYSLTLSGALMEFKNVRLPKTEASEGDKGDNPEEVEGMILERVYLLEEIIRLVNELFKMFLVIRVSSGWSEELFKMKDWVEKSAVVA
jgi:hypothetical protein